MDTYSSGGVGASIVIVLGILYKTINHKHIRSKCCGRKIDVSIDVDESTPPTNQKQSSLTCETSEHSSKDLKVSVPRNKPPVVED